MPVKNNPQTTIPSLCQITTLIALLLGAGGAYAQEGRGYPVKDFLAQTVFREVAVSPDGRRVAFTTAKDDLEKDAEDVAIWRIDVSARGGRSDRLRLTREPGNYSGLQWSPDGRYLAFVSTRKPADSPQLFVLDSRGGEPVMITDQEKFKKGIIAYDWAPDSSAVVFVARDLPEKAKEKALKDLYGDVQRFTSETPRTTFYRLETEGFSKRAAEAFATVEASVAEISISPDKRKIAYVTGPASDFGSAGFSEIELFIIPFDGKQRPRQVTSNFVSEARPEWDRSSTSLFVSSVGDPSLKRTNYTQARLARVDASSGRLENLAPGFAGAFGEYLKLPDDLLLATAAVSTSVNLYKLAGDARPPKALTRFRGSVSRISASSDAGLLAFVLADNRSFQELYLAEGLDRLDRASKATDFNSELEKLPAPEIETIKWSNGEGDTIEGVLYWPPGKRDAKNLPLVVDIHGGPWSLRTEAITLGDSTYAYYPALLASRGYLVLEPNYRGGTGRGDAFLSSLDGYSCSRPSTDIMTGVDFLIASGAADRGRMGVMGYSYGGLLTNCLITRTDRFRAASSGAGIWNDLSYFGSADNFVQNDVRNSGKAPWEDFKNYWDESAISGAGRIRTPTLVVIGGADRRVPTSQGHELYRALVRLGVPAELLVFPGEGHVFRRPSHKKTKIEAEIRWLDSYLLGKTSPKIE
ncbi:MAG TPA: S9 family peptidase [Blastocatellia bacterium]|nr:S9 family peptidase [Blastocatellia bacterium]